MTGISRPQTTSTCERDYYEACPLCLWPGSGPALTRSVHVLPLLPPTTCSHWIKEPWVVVVASLFLWHLSVSSVTLVWPSSSCFPKFSVCEPLHSGRLLASSSSTSLCSPLISRGPLSSISWSPACLVNIWLICSEARSVLPNAQGKRVGGKGRLPPPDPAPYRAS